MFLELLIGSAIIAALSPNSKPQQKSKCEFCEGKGYVFDTELPLHKRHQRYQCYHCDGTGISKNVKFSEGNCVEYKEY